MEYSGLYPDLLSENQKKIIKERNHNRDQYILLQVPGIYNKNKNIGVGKTSNMLATGLEDNLIYTVLQEGAGEAYLFRDSSFDSLIEDLRMIHDYQIHNHSQGYIYSFILSRLFHIWLLLEYYPDSSNPQQILFNQINNSIFLDFYHFIKMNCLEIADSQLINLCNDLIKKINKKSNKKTGFSLDECNVLDEHYEKFYSWKGTKRGILKIIIHCLINIKFDFYMYAGTKMGFEETISILIII
jgi:hypothetical protein